MKMVEFSWEEIMQITKNIAAEIKEDGGITEIYGIPRGGTLFAVLLSHELKIPILENRRGITKKTLIVDDIIDSGETITDFIANTPGCKIIARYKIASIVVCITSSITPNYFGRRKSEDSWVVFPWETSSSTKKNSQGSASL